MKVILEPAYWTELLGETDADPSTLLRPTAEDVLRSWSVSRDGNSPRHDRANLLDRIELPDKSRDDPAGRLLAVRGEVR
jgi:putative SOS response-associated peptidase YedK